MKRYWAPALVLLWPWIYFAAYVFPTNGQVSAVGNDFGYLYYVFKIYLLDELSHGHFPLWSPSEAAGFPFYVNPFAQAFYPLNVPLALIYRLIGGFDWVDYQAYTVLGICLNALGTYCWLRSLKLSKGSALVASLIVPVSFKMAELLRFPNAIHAAAWHPWILFAITKMFDSQNRKQLLLHGAALSGFVVLLVTAGYPYYAYYSVFLVGPYVLLFWMPGFPIGERTARLKRTLLVGAFGILGGLVVSPYLIKMQQMLGATQDRDGKSFSYSTEHVWYWKDTLGSLAFPPWASIEGWYYFGIGGLLLILWFLVTPARRLGRAMPPFFTTLTFKLALLGWFATITYITYGRESQLFRFLWNHMPGFAALRVWGRMNIILLPLFAWLLAMAWESFSELLTGERTRGWLRGSLELLTVTAPYAAVLGVQWYLYSLKPYHGYWDQFVSHPPGTEARFLINGAWAEAGLLALYLVSRFRPLRLGWAQLVLGSGLVLLFWQDVRPIGNFGWSGGLVRYPQKRANLNVAIMNERSFSVSRHGGFGTLSLSPSFSVDTIANWYFGRYVAFRARTENERGHANVLLGVSHGSRRIFFSSSIDHPTVESFLNDDAVQTATSTVVSYNGDRLELQVASPAKRFLSFIDNWDPDWRAYVDGSPVAIQLLFGTFKSIPVPEGSHTVVFAYQPWSR